MSLDLCYCQDQASEKSEKDPAAIKSGHTHAGNFCSYMKLRPAYYRTKYEFLLYYDDGRQRVICRFLPGTLFVCFRLFQHIAEAAKTVVLDSLV